jgi:hypothetical protein
MGSAGLKPASTKPLHSRDFMQTSRARGRQRDVFLLWLTIVRNRGSISRDVTHL